MESELIDIKAVVSMVPIGRTTIYKLMRLGKFPRQVALDVNKSLWRKSDVQQFLDDLKQREVQE